jgi:uncharacterized protein YbaP (TraB family)
MTIKKLYKLPTVKAFSLIALFLFSASASSNSSVWKVSKDNDHVFIGGTIHVLPEEEFPLPDEFMNAYKNTDKVILEAQLPDPTDMAAQQAMIAQMSYNNGMTLQSVLTPNTYEMLAKYFEVMGMNLGQFINFKPGFVVSIMALIELQKSEISGEGVDVYFEELATKDDKAMGYLETADFQFKMLSGLGEGYEDEFIKANIELNSDFTDFFQNTLDAWRSGDAENLETLINTASMESDPRSYDALFTQRNKNWVPKIEALFNNKNKEFVLVGAGHLFGKDGLLTLLKSKGYVIEQKSS